MIAGSSTKSSIVLLKGRSNTKRGASKERRRQFAGEDEYPYLSWMVGQSDS